ncbi:hypothetical protein HMI56_003077, partial [Coelomomyces lativittatus]
FEDGMRSGISGSLVTFARRVDCSKAKSNSDECYFEIFKLKENQYTVIYHDQGYTISGPEEMDYLPVYNYCKLNNVEKRKKFNKVTVVEIEIENLLNWTIEHQNNAVVP